MKHRDAFTLTELLVLLPIIAMLGTFLFASLDSSKQTLQAAQCLSNMRQWGLAMGMYANDYHDYMPYEGQPFSDITSGFNLGSWYNVLPHYINQPTLKDLYDSSPPNIPLPGQRSIYICPSVTAPASTYTGAPTTSNPYFGYAMNRVNTGVSGHVYTRSKAALPGQVILFSESENNSFPFVDGNLIGSVPSSGILVPPRHSGGMNFVFVDGHAQWYKLADYSRTLSEANNADVEWAKTRALYWFPCGDPDACNKQ